MSALVSAVRVVGQMDMATLPGTTALADVSVLLSLEGQLAAVRLARLADLDRRGLPVLAGASSTGAWLEEQPVPGRREQLTLARRLDRMPHVAAAVRAGRLALRTAELLGATLDRTRRLVDRLDGLVDGQPGEAAVSNVLLRGIVELVCEGVGGFDEDDPGFDVLVGRLLVISQSSGSQQDRLEQGLVLLAQTLDRALLPAALDRLLDALRPQQLQDAAARAGDLRGLKLRLDSDGAGYTLARARLTLALGEVLTTVINAEMATDPDNTLDSAGWRARHADDADPPPADQAPATPGATGEPGEAGQAGHEDAPVSPRLPRTLAQRRHDALLIGLRRLLDSGALGSRDKIAPHLAVTVPLDTLNELPGALPAVSRTTGTRLPLTFVTSLLCQSRLTRLVLNLRGRVRETGHTERTAKAHERLQISTRWGHRCAHRHCPAPPGTPLRPHHATSWASTHRTAVDDQIPLCDHSHDDLHIRRQTITLRDGRQLGPDGWVSRQRAAA